MPGSVGGALWGPGVPPDGQGTEFVARRTQQWLRMHRIEHARIEPGKPWQNGVVESFHRSLRSECLNREWFVSRAEATRLHSSLGYRTPAEIRAASDTSVDTTTAKGGSQNQNLSQSRWSCNRGTLHSMGTECPKYLPSCPKNGLPNPRTEPETWS